MFVESCEFIQNNFCFCAAPHQVFTARRLVYSIDHLKHFPVSFYSTAGSRRSCRGSGVVKGVDEVVKVEEASAV